MRKKNEVLLALGMVFVVASPGLAAERHVPSEYATIQAAIDACSNGDEVIIAQGTYTGDGNRDISFLGKAITVRSEDPNDPNVVAATVIDCQGTGSNPHRGFVFDSGEGPNSVLCGLTITNGHAADGADGTEIYPIGGDGAHGGGIFCDGSSPTVRQCVLSGNEAGHGGGAYWAYGAGGNGGRGGGIYCVSSTAVIVSCTIAETESLANSGY